MYVSETGAWCFHHPDISLLVDDSLLLLLPLLFES